MPFFCYVNVKVTNGSKEFCGRAEQGNEGSLANPDANVLETEQVVGSGTGDTTVLAWPEQEGKASSMQSPAAETREAGVRARVTFSACRTTERGFYLTRVGGGLARFQAWRSAKMQKSRSPKEFRQGSAAPFQANACAK
ncbi:hypothetical protein MHU86_22542 [Fragilaria crotonensis]|nr:hypothetical protein MHU86_22542 [Fragilaria crotonensis]